MNEDPGYKRGDPLVLLLYKGLRVRVRLIIQQDQQVATLEGLILEGIQILLGTVV